MKKKRNRIPLAKRDELIAIYMVGGMRGVAAAARQAGVTPKYVSSAASSLGLLRRRKGVCMLTFDDPRWERAKRIGEVRA